MIKAFAGAAISLAAALAGCSMTGERSAQPPTPAAASVLSVKEQAHTYRDHPKEGWYGPRHWKMQPANSPIRAARRARPDCPKDLPGDDVFNGCDRAAAKTSFVSRPPMTFTSVAELRRSLSPDPVMVAKKISVKADSGRVAEERRNVTVTAVLYAYLKEDDNDYHLIIGDPGCTSPACVMTAEVSGLPRNRRYLAKLRQARTAFERQIKGIPAKGSYYRVLVKPIPVRVTGSLFYDVPHAPDPEKPNEGEVGPGTDCLSLPSGGRIGCRPNTAWELHPVTEIDLNPARGPLSERRQPRG